MVEDDDGIILFFMTKSGVSSITSIYIFIFLILLNGGLRE